MSDVQPIRDKVVRGVPWAVLSYGSTKAITVMTTIVLARVLVPADFGLVALGLLIVGLVLIIGNLGLGNVLVMGPDLDQRARGTFLTLMVGFSVAVALVVAALSPLLARLLQEPRLAGVAAALAIAIAVGGFNTFYEAILQRELDFRSRFLSQLAQSVSYAAVAIGLAVAGWGVGALVAGQIASAVAYALMLWGRSPARVRPAFDRPVAREAVSQGRAFMAQGGLAFLKQNVDYVAVGRLLGPAPLGFYAMAYRFSELPYMAIGDPVARVTFPAFARLRDRGEDVAGPFLSALRLVALLACPLGVLLSGAAEPFTRGVLGERWLASVPALAVLGIWGAIRPLHATTGWMLNSIGAAGLLARISTWVLVVLVPSLFAAAHFGGIEAVSWVMLGEVVVAEAVLARAASRRAGVALGRQWRSLRPVLLACPVAWAVSRLVSEAMAGPPPLVVLVLAVAGGAAAYLLVLRVAEPGLLSQVGRQARQAVRPAPSAAG